MKREKWTAVSGYEGLYEVSNQGRVRSLGRWTTYQRKDRKRPSKRFFPGGLMNFETDEHGYFRVTLCKNGRARHWFVHRLVASAFIPNPTGRPYINHKDTDKNNNDVSNLEWATAKENTLHAVANGVHSFMQKNKITPADVPVILNRIAAGENRKQIAADYGTQESHIFKIKNGHTWKRVVSEWKRVHGEIRNQTWKRLQEKQLGC